MYLTKEQTKYVNYNYFPYIKQDYYELDMPSIWIVFRSFYEDNAFYQLFIIMIISNILFRLVIVTCSCSFMRRNGILLLSLKCIVVRLFGRLLCILFYPLITWSFFDLRRSCRNLCVVMSFLDPCRMIF